ncbi:MAG: hypothetical protein JXA68_12215, partial [Ignavibacteriales bacterium]|nr:hypothetical protein [Ignavibacteriales bacterium]
MSMFCYQCQETAKNTGCTVKGVCGKTDDLAAMQDLLIYVLKGISIYSMEARKKGLEKGDVSKFIFDSLFMTITNANFDKQRFIDKITEGLLLRNSIEKMMQEREIVLNKSNLHNSATWNPSSTNEYEEKARNVGVLSTENEDVRSLRELVIYGLKGMAAYAEHAANLGYTDKEVIEFMEKGLVATTNDNLSIEELVALVIECGEKGVKVMALLDKANTTTYGNPEITKVNIGVKDNPSILISGHDLKDMEELLEQTEGTGVDVYTHSEMLPAHYYP